MAGDLGQVKDKGIKTEMAAFFYNADRDYGTKVAQAVNLNLGEVQQRAAELEE